MGMVIGDNFDYKGKKPLDARMLFNTIADMKNFNENYLPDITLAFNKADGKMYMFNRSNDVDDTTGKWREFEGGESIQVETLPTASENVGKVYQYIGADTQNYKHDFFYESKYVEGEQEEYQRVAVDVQEGNYDTLKNKPVFVHSPSQQLYGWTAEYETGGETETYDFLTLIDELPENGNISVYDAEAEEWDDLEMIDGLAYGEDTVTRNSSIDQDITVIKKEINEKYYDIIGMTELPTPSNEYVNKVYKHVGDTVQIKTPGGTVVDVYNQDLVTCQRINNSYYWTKYSMSTMLSYLPKYWMGGYGEANNYYHDTNKTIVSYNGALYIGTVDWNTFQWTWTPMTFGNKYGFHHTSGYSDIVTVANNTNVAIKIPQVSLDNKTPNQIPEAHIHFRYENGSTIKDVGKMYIKFSATDAKPLDVVFEPTAFFENGGSSADAITRAFNPKKIYYIAEHESYDQITYFIPNKSGYTLKAYVEFIDFGSTYNLKAVNNNYMSSGAKTFAVRLSQGTQVETFEGLEDYRTDTILQYIGTTDANYTQGHFYKKTEYPNTWTEISVNNGTLVDLEDTNITNPTNGDVLTYNETNNKRENKEVEADSSKVSYRGMTVEQALDEEYKPVENLITDDTKVIDGFWFKENGVCRIDSTSIPEFQSYYIPVEEGKTYYTASKMNSLWIGYLDEDEQAVDSLTVSGVSITIPTGQGIKYLSYPQRQAYKPVTIISEKPAEFVEELDIYRMTSAGEQKMQFPSSRANGNYYSTNTAFTTQETAYWYADYTYNLEDSIIGIGAGFYILGVNTQDNTAIALNTIDKIYIFDIANNAFVQGDSPITIPEEWQKNIPNHKTPSGLHGMVRVDDANNYILRAEGLSDLIIPKSTIKTRVESQSKVFEDYTTASGMVWYYGNPAYLNAGVFTARHRGPIVEKKSTDISNPWYGKTWYAYGTSMTDTTMNGYTVELQSLLGANLTNWGKGGSGIIPSLHGGTSGDNTYTRVKNTTDGKTNADLITLEIIPNDISGTLGTPTDNYADGTTETFCGCLNELLQYLQVNTTAQIVVLIATRSRYNYQDTTEKYPPESQKATDWLQWTDAAKECCRRNCVPFIDGQSNCGLGYARVSGDNKYVQDQIHLTTLGAKNLGQYFYSQIKNIPLFYSA